jgi:DNA-directed RNA polymerase subunit RPC12/RpoP
MRKLGPIRCPGCHHKLCEAVEGIARLEFRCRHCRLQVVVVLTVAGAHIMAAA